MSACSLKQRCPRTIGWAGALALLGACASAPPPAPAVSGRAAPVRAELPAVVDVPPSARGNPPFYEVLGQRYYVLRSASGYRERGIASWYGKDFHGLSTAGGEPYDMYALTAAHKTLPIPTWVEVTNVKNGKHVIVKINDRGPFVGNRLIDLSYGAAQALDIIRTGTALVEVRALGVSSAAPMDDAVPLQAQAPAREQTQSPSFEVIRSADAATLSTTDTPVRPLYVQVGAFAERRNAEKLLQRLVAGGYTNAFIASEGKRTRTLYRVRLGPFSSSSEYDRLRERMQAFGIVQTQLIVGQ
jgi:rare lipoprotein A